MAETSLRRSLSTLEYFTFGFGTMVGAGWVVLMDDWLSRGGPGGAALAYAVGGLLLLPVALTYGRLVRAIPDAGAEIAFARGVMPPAVCFAAGWMMVLAYAIVCPWEAVAVGNLLARLVPAMNTHPLYSIAGRTIFAPRLLLGYLLTGVVALVNDRGIRLSGRFQNVATLAFLLLVLVFVGLGLAHGSAAHLEPLFPSKGVGGVLLGTFLVLQIVPYFMTGFESVAKGAEEARTGFDPRGFARAIVLSLGFGALFYVVVILSTAYVFPWTAMVHDHLGTEAAFERASSSVWLSRIILVAALLSLVKIFNGNFLAATRLVFAIGRSGLVHPSLGAVNPRHQTPRRAILLAAAFTLVASSLGDAVLVPTTEVGSLAAGVGWLSACASFLLRSRGEPGGGRLAAALGVGVSLLIVLMKVVPGVPGSFTAWEWTALMGWSGLGLFFWLRRPRVSLEGNA